MRRRAEAKLSAQPRTNFSGFGQPKSDADSQRLLHELQVHQIELEMQNTEQRQTRDELETSLENFTDLYDFAPVGYFTISAAGVINQVNLTGTNLVGIERARLVNRFFGTLVVPELRPVFHAFLKKVFASQTKLFIDLELLGQSGQPLRAVNLEARRLLNGQECRVAVMDITARKRVEETQRRVEVLAASNKKLEAEIIHRQAVEQSLKQSEQLQTGLLIEARQHQAEMRQLSREVLQAQEEERKRISRELHEVIAQLRTRLAEAEETLRAIRHGEVDSVLVAGKAGSQVFTLEGAGHAYRMLIESMNEGALTLTRDKTILYANDCFARMVKLPLEQVAGSSFRRFLSVADRALLRPLMKMVANTGAKIQVQLQVSDGSWLPVQISVREIAKDSSHRLTLGMVVTDMTEVRRNEEILRALTNRVVQVQEAERGRVALELHDGITQLLCAILVRCQTLAEQLPTQDSPARREAIKLRDLLGEAAEEVERISRNLRPSVLNELGLVAVLGDTSTEFAQRTGVRVQLTCPKLAERLPADTELALYRIFQEALKNVAQHARARRVTVQLIKQDGAIQLTITDDGIGFEPGRRVSRRKGKGGFGLLGMLERTTFAAGTMQVKSAPGKGTTVQVQIPLAVRIRKIKL